MDKNNQTRGASQGKQQGQNPQGQQVAQGAGEGQQGNLQQGGVDQGATQQGSSQGSTQQGSNQQGSMQQGSTQQGSMQQGSTQQGSMQQGSMQGAQQGAVQGAVQGTQQGSAQQGSRQDATQAGSIQQGAGATGGQAGGAMQRRQDANDGVLRPPVDVIEDAGGITLLADLPGVSKENLNLRLEAQSLTIEGAMSLDLPADMEPRHAEVRHQHFERTFALSRELNGEEATAELHHGVLHIRIPKSKDAMPRKIPINAS